MKAMAIAVVLLASGTALAQDYGTTPTTTPDTTMPDMMPDSTVPDATTTHDTMTHPVTTTTTTTQDATSATDAWSATPTTVASAPVSGQVVQPSNANPELDARGIAVISLAAVVPPGFNNIPGSAVGGPLLDPATGQEIAAADAPPCTAEVTDRCLQTYERGRER